MLSMPSDDIMIVMHAADVGIRDFTRVRPVARRLGVTKPHLSSSQALCPANNWRSTKINAAGDIESTSAILVYGPSS